jgi:hypothetical protein
MDFVSREQVLEILKAHDASPELTKAISDLFCFPAPNPEWRRTDRNVMGQTEEEFWALLDRKS